MMLIWEKYFLAEFLKSALFFILSFFTLYSFIEYFTHEGSLGWSKQIVYYGNQLIKRSSFLFPISLLLATIKVVTKLDRENEWLILQLAGLSSRRLFRPFFLLSLGSTLLLYLNFEYLLPKALQQLEEGEAHQKKTVSQLLLEDNSRLFYRSIDGNQLSDLIWIENSNEYWKIKTFFKDRHLALYADHLLKDKEGSIKKIESYEEILLPQIRFNPEKRVPLEQQKISDLLRSVISNLDRRRENLPLWNNFLFKATFPLLPSIAVTALFPFCLRSTKRGTLFILYAAAIFLFLLFYMFIDGLLILGNYGTVDTGSLIIAIYASLISIISWNFWNKTSSFRLVP